MRRIAVLALVAIVALVAAGAVFAFKKVAGRSFYLKTGDNVYIDGLDLQCHYDVNYAERNFLLCARESDTPHSIYIYIESGKVVVYRDNGSFTKPAPVLYQHARNP